LEKENGSKLQAEIADWVIMKDILFQNQNKGIIVKEAYRILKKGGKVILVEWNNAKSAVGPVQEMRFDQVSAEKMFNGSGFIVEKNIEAGHFHYAFVAVKQ
jgi:ubiquinone/menaquinone biosynthesis C-methylase UbiE